MDPQDLAPEAEGAEVRLFVGLYPPELALRALPRRTGREHVTLAFLGDVEDPARVAAALRGVAQLPAPRLRLAGAGRFRAGAVWLALAGDLPALDAVHAAVQDAVRVAGLPVDPGPWRPHLTVGRGRLPAELLAYEGPPSRWRELALVRSTLGRGAPTHERLATYPLAG